MTIATSTSRGPLPESFNELNALHPLRPIKDDVDYDNAIQIIDRLAVLERPTEDQADYLATLTELVAKYDAEHYRAELSSATPLDRLNYLLEQNGMNASALGDLLKNRSLGSKILRGERELSKAHIRILADRFKVSPALFL